MTTPCSHRSTLRWFVSLAVAVTGVVAGGACSNAKNDAAGKQTWSCVLSDPDGKTGQCFSRTDDKTAEAHAKDCEGFEVAEGGKKTLVKGDCPEEGVTGKCVTKDPGGGTRDTPCYRALKQCEDSCKTLGGTFAKK